MFPESSDKGRSGCALDRVEVIACRSIHCDPPSASRASTAITCAKTKGSVCAIVVTSVASWSWMASATVGVRREVGCPTAFDLGAAFVAPAEQALAEAMAVELELASRNGRCAHQTASKGGTQNATSAGDHFTAYQWR